MSKLVSLNEVACYLGQPASTTKMTAKFSGLVDQVEALLQNLLCTRFERSTVQDLYELPKRYEGPRYFSRSSPRSAYRYELTEPLRNGQFAFFLDRGFVDSGQTVTLYTADSLTDVLTTTETFNATLVDYEKGLIYVDPTELQTLYPYVRITYTAGFEDSATGDSFTGVPSWLSEAVLQAVAYNYKKQKGCDDGPASACSCVVPPSVGLALEDKIRFYAEVLRPFNTMVS